MSNKLEQYLLFLKGDQLKYCYENKKNFSTSYNIQAVVATENEGVLGDVSLSIY